jgi:hypothetical protein
MRAARGNYSRRELTRLLESIDGWLEAREAWALYETALRCVDAFPDLTAVEIGSWRGRSTTAIATDPHLQTCARGEGERSNAEALVANLSRAGVRPFVRIVRSHSSIACASFAPESVGFLFVDGSHAYEDVTRDIVDWSPCLAEGATVAFHDAASRRGVYQALLEHVLRDGKGFGSPRMVQSTLFVTRTCRASRRTTQELRVARVGLWLARLEARARAWLRLRVPRR